MGKVPIKHSAPNRNHRKHQTTKKQLRQQVQRPVGLRPGRSPLTSQVPLVLSPAELSQNYAVVPSQQQTGYAGQELQYLTAGQGYAGQGYGEGYGSAGQGYGEGYGSAGQGYDAAALTALLSSYGESQQAELPPQNPVYHATPLQPDGSILKTSIPIEEPLQEEPRTEKYHVKQNFVPLPNYYKDTSNDDEVRADCLLVFL